MGKMARAIERWGDPGKLQRPGKRPARLFADDYLFAMYGGRAGDEIMHMATFNKWAHWKQMIAYSCPTDHYGDGCMDHPGDRANDYSPEPPEES